MVPEQIVLAGVGLLPLIVGLVTITKQLGLPDRYAPIAALLLGVLGLAGARASGIEGAPESYFAVALQGLTLGLAAAGLHSTVATLSRGETLVRADQLPPGVSLYVGTAKGEPVPVESFHEGEEIEQIR